jgi:hypothetical protein
VFVVFFGLFGPLSLDVTFWCFFDLPRRILIHTLFSTITIHLGTFYFCFLTFFLCPPGKATWVSSLACKLTYKPKACFFLFLFVLFFTVGRSLLRFELFWLK